MMTHARIEEQIAAYVLDAMDDEERRSVEPELLDHVAGCEPCRQTYATLREVAGDLALAVDPIPLPAGLEAKVLSATEQFPVAHAPIPRRARKWSQVAVAAALVAIGALGGTTLQTARSDREARLAVRLMSDVRTESATLVGSKRGSGLIFVAPDGEGVLIARGFTGPRKGSVLKLWLLHDGNAVPSVAFNPEDDIIPIRVAPGDYDAAAVTVERDPDAQAPTTEPIYSGALKT